MLPGSFAPLGDLYGYIPLERSYLVSVGNAGPHERDDRLRVVDLDYRLKSADQLSVTPLGGRADAFIVHRILPRAFVVRESAGDILAVDLPWGSVSRVAEGLARPSMLAPLGADVAVADRTDGGRLIRYDGGGARVAELSFTSEVAALAQPTGETLIAVALDGSGALLGARDAAARRLPPGKLCTPACGGRWGDRFRRAARNILVRCGRRPGPNGVGPGRTCSGWIVRAG